MARINLLPWREERRKARQKEFGVMLALAALAGVLVAFLVFSFYKGQISGQNARNEYLRGEITKVDEQIKEIDALDQKKSKLLARKEVIEELQSNRSQMVHLFDSLVRTIPDGVVLTGIKQEGDQLTLSGRTQSNARVSTYMRNLETSGWMSNPELRIIEAKAQERSQGGTAIDIKALPYVFELKVSLPASTIQEDEDGLLGDAGLVEEAAEVVPAADANAVDPAAVPPGGQAPAADAAAPAAAPGPDAAAPAATPAAAPATTPATTVAAS